MRSCGGVNYFFESVSSNSAQMYGLIRGYQIVHVHVNAHDVCAQVHTHSISTSMSTSTSTSVSVSLSKKEVLQRLKVEALLIFKRF
jgi:hypothetical protein